MFRRVWIGTIVNKPQRYLLCDDQSNPHSNPSMSNSIDNEFPISRSRLAMIPFLSIRFLEELCRRNGEAGYRLFTE